MTAGRRVEDMYPDETVLGQAAGDVIASRFARIVFIKHNDDVALPRYVLLDQFLLGW